MFSFGSDLGIPNGSNTSFLIPDLGRATDVFDLYEQHALAAHRARALNNNRTIEEDDSAAFLQFDFTTDIAGHGLRGNIGIRYVKTEQSSHRLHLPQRCAGCRRVRA